RLAFRISDAMRTQTPTLTRESSWANTYSLYIAVSHAANAFFCDPGRGRAGPLPRPLESLGKERMGKTLPRRRSDVQSMVARKPKWKSWPTGQLCRPKDRSRCESLARQTLGSRRSGLAAIIW